jgi:hypothetical protein
MFRQHSAESATRCFGVRYAVEVGLTSVVAVHVTRSMAVRFLMAESIVLEEGGDKIYFLGWESWSQRSLALCIRGAEEWLFIGSVGTNSDVGRDWCRYICSILRALGSRLYFQESKVVFFFFHCKLSLVFDSIEAD